MNDTEAKKVVIAAIAFNIIAVLLIIFNRNSDYFWLISLLTVLIDIVMFGFYIFYKPRK